jgi:hypothetical protein
LILTTEESKNDDPAERKKAMKDVEDKLLKQTGFELYPGNIEKAEEAFELADKVDELEGK